jgi:hypothetical protein
VLLALAGVVYLRPFTVGGNDIALIGVLTVAGLVLGAWSGLADKVCRGDQGAVISRATTLSVITWVLGMGSRFGFAYYSYHSGTHAMASFSAHHDITGARIWTTALVLMAFGQGLARVGVLQLRRLQTARTSVVVGVGATTMVSRAVYPLDDAGAQVLATAGPPMHALHRSTPGRGAGGRTDTDRR